MRREGGEGGEQLTLLEPVPDARHLCSSCASPVSVSPAPASSITPPPVIMRLLVLTLMLLAVSHAQVEILWLYLHVESEIPLTALHLIVVYLSNYL